MKRTLAFLIFGLGTQAFGQNLVVNGDFSLAVPSDGTGGGWTATSNDINAGWSSTGGNLGGTYILNDDAKPLANPTLAQTLTLVVGQTYRITVDVASGHGGIYGGGPTKDFGIEIDGNLWEHVMPNEVTDWTTFTHTFTATSTSGVLQFSAERYDDKSARIDNVSVEAVPEPASMAALGLGALGLLRRRRRA